MVELEEGIRLKNGKVVVVVELEEGIRLKNEKVVVMELEEGIRLKGEWEGGGDGSLVMGGGGRCLEVR